MLWDRCAGETQVLKAGAEEWMSTLGIENRPSLLCFGSCLQIEVHTLLVSESLWILVRKCRCLGTTLTF